jgi:transglutaminase-like putative cysteine protease
MVRSIQVLVLLLAACSHGRVELAPPTSEDDPAARAALVASAMEGYRAAFVLTWNGRRIGEAREKFFAADDAEGGFRFERKERVIVRRGDATSVAHTTIVIDVDAAMIARRVVVERDAGGPPLEARATRMSDDGWSVQVGDAPARLADGAAVPSTLVPLYVAAGGNQGRVFDGPVLVEGANLATARLAVDVERGTARSRYLTAAGELRAVARLDAQNRLVEAGLGAALGSRRVEPAALDAPFEPPEIVDSAAIPVAGTSPAEASATGARGAWSLRLTVSGVRVPPPALPEIPEQTVAMAPGGTWDVVVEPTAFPVAGTGPWRELRERTDWVAHALADDLRVATLSPAEALAAGRGDCTAHAVVLEEDLHARGYQTRLVTGFVVEDGALRRHRWVAVRIGKRWIPVDPMFDEVPARPTHIALAVHGASPDELAFIDDVVFAGWSSAIAAWSR